MSAFRPALSLAARRYFASGWAFLVPYLACYWVYRQIDGPVNAPHGALPSLLHVFWTLHVAHLVLGAVAVWSHARESRSAGNAQSRDWHGPMFWLLLGLLLWIPGAYLEYPADPWEHLARINEWSAHESAGQHSFGEKWTYFFSYSWQRWVKSALGWRHFADLLNTATGLLLCWQYYRLARAVGASPGAAKIFVLLQMLLMGNSVFSFYRYYGLSSAVFAQIGAVAITRAALVHLSGAWHGRTLLLATFGVGVAIWTTYHAHVQGVGIAVFGVMAVALWRLASVGRRALITMAGGFIALSVGVVLFWPRPPYIDEQFVSAGWLHAWYGFALFTPDGPAAERAWAILGGGGVASLVAGAWLLRKNHVAGWLTWTPVLALLTPAIGLPLASALGAADPIRIVNFARFLFAVPLGLALVVVAECYFRARWQTPETRQTFIVATAATAIVALLILPVGRGGFSRLWHVVAVTPPDLELRHFTNGARVQATEPAPPGVRYVRNSITPVRAGEASLYDSIAWIPLRLTGAPRGPELMALQQEVATETGFLRRVTLADPEQLETPGSTAGRLSGHWSPQAVALEHAGFPELRKQLAELDALRDGPSDEARFVLPPSDTRKQP